MLFLLSLPAEFSRTASEGFLKYLAKIFLVAESCQITDKMNPGIILPQKIHRRSQPYTVQYSTKRISCLLIIILERYPA